MSPSGRIRRAFTVGTWDYNNGGHHTSVHEFGHCFGLPDLYPTADNRHQLWSTGGWDKMSESHIAGHFLGWHRHKFGWISEERTSTSFHGYTKIVTLSPYSSKYGFVIHTVQFEINRALVVEIAEPIPGASGRDNVEGVLMYVVDSNITSGNQPITILPKTPRYHPTLGNNYLAPWAVGDREQYRDETQNYYVSLHVISKFWDSYIINVGVSFLRLADQTD
jgi:hypothetical protein